MQCNICFILTQRNIKRVKIVLVQFLCVLYTLTLIFSSISSFVICSYTLSLPDAIFLDSQHDLWRSGELVDLKFWWDSWWLKLKLLLVWHYERRVAVWLLPKEISETMNENVSTSCLQISPDRVVSIKNFSYVKLFCHDCHSQWAIMWVTRAKVHLLIKILRNIKYPSA